jgi:transcriptional regulator with XRE-family HTH domain
MEIQMNSMKVQRFFRGISQEELALRVGVDQPAISNIERDKAKETPRTIRIKKAVAEILGVPVELLFPGKGDLP